MVCFSWLLLLAKIKRSSNHFFNRSQGLLVHILHLKWPDKWPRSSTTALCKRVQSQIWCPTLFSVFPQSSLLLHFSLQRKAPKSTKTSQTFCFPGPADHNPSNAGHLTRFQADTEGRSKPRRGDLFLCTDTLHLFCIVTYFTTQCSLPVWLRPGGHKHNIPVLSESLLSIHKTNRNLSRQELTLLHK